MLDLTGILLGKACVASKKYRPFQTFLSLRINIRRDSFVSFIRIIRSFKTFMHFSVMTLVFCLSATKCAHSDFASVCYKPCYFSSLSFSYTGMMFRTITNLFFQSPSNNRESDNESDDMSLLDLASESVSIPLDISDYLVIYL